MIINNQIIKAKSIDELKQKLARIEDPIILDIVFSTDDFASSKYVEMKKKLGQELGIKVNVHRSYSDVNIEASNGVIIQIPCASEEEQYLEVIPKHLDIDLFNNRDQMLRYGILPPTIKGIFQVLDNPKDLRGKTIVVIGQGKLVGKPLIDCLLDYEATIISCNEHTHNIKKYTQDAFIIISGTGVPNLIDESWINKEKPQYWIDAGTAESNGKIIGDIDQSIGEYSNIHLCPSPKGIGPLTVVNIFHNLVDMYVLKSLLTKESN